MDEPRGVQTRPVQSAEFYWHTETTAYSNSLTLNAPFLLIVICVQLSFCHAKHHTCLIWTITLTLESLWKESAGASEPFIRPQGDIFKDALFALSGEVHEFAFILETLKTLLSFLKYFILIGSLLSWCPHTFNTAVNALPVWALQTVASLIMKVVKVLNNWKLVWKQIPFNENGRL